MQFPGGWSALTSDENQWIEADFGVAVRVDAVVTQGRQGDGHNQWVTSYKVCRWNIRNRPGYSLQCEKNRSNCHFDVFE